MKRLLRSLTEPVEHTLLQAPRALVASVLATAVDFCVLVGLVEAAGWSPLVAVVISYFAGGVVQYYLCAVWVFPAAPRSIALGFTAFTLLSLVSLAVTWATVAVLCDLLYVNYALAKGLSLGPSFAWNFLSRKFLLFKPATNGPPVSERVLGSGKALPEGDEACSWGRPAMTAGPFDRQVPGV